MEEINLKDFLIYLKRYIIAFILVTGVVVGGVVFYDKQVKKPIYQASTTIVIAKSDGNENAAAALNDVNTSQKLTSTYSEIAKSELVLGKVVENLEELSDVKALAKNVTVKPVDNTSILSVAVKDADPERATMVANEIAEVFAEEVTKIYKLDNVRQLSMAEVPTAPANNTMTRDVVLAVAGSVAAVLALAFIRFYLDDTVKSSDDIEKMFGVTAVGRISKETIKGKKGKGEKRGRRGRKAGARDNSYELIVDRLPKSAVSENMKSLRTNLQFTAIDKNLKTILVTSANASDGKSFVSANLAISFAQAGKKVLLVDCDLRKGRVHRLFNLPNIDGLSNLLTDDLEKADGYIRETSVKNLEVITCGTYPPNPSELLASQKNKALLESLRERYDIVILDGVPVGGLADSVILASLVDETIIVTKDAGTARSALAATKAALEKVDAKIAGVVFNMVSRKSSSKYYDNYYYYSDHGRKKQK